VTANTGEDLTFLVEPLNRVRQPPGLCPSCRGRDYLDVYATHVEWACGFTYPLPPLPSVKGAPGRRAAR